MAFYEGTPQHLNTIQNAVQQNLYGCLHMMLFGDGLRESTKYLVSIPFKFAATLSMFFIVLYAIFKYMEFQSGSTDPHNDLAFYTLLMATLFAIDGLAIMCMEWASRRQSENRIKRYLKRISNNGV